MSRQSPVCEGVAVFLKLSKRRKPTMGHQMERRQLRFSSGECTGWVCMYSVSYADSNAEVLNCFACIVERSGTPRRSCKRKERLVITFSFVIIDATHSLKRVNTCGPVLIWQPQRNKRSEWTAVSTGLSRKSQWDAKSPSPRCIFLYQSQYCTPWF